MRKILKTCDICGDTSEAKDDPDFYMNVNIGGLCVASRTIDLCDKCKKKKGLISWVLDIGSLEKCYREGQRIPGTIYGSGANFGKERPLIRIKNARSKRRKTE